MNVQFYFPLLSAALTFLLIIWVNCYSSCLYWALIWLRKNKLCWSIYTYVISPALFNHFVSDYPIPELDMTSYADDFTLLASTPSIVEAESRANQLCSSPVRWADDKQLAIAFQKSIVTLYTSDTHQSRLHPQVRIGDAVTPLNITPKILGVTLDTHFTFGLHARDCVERASSLLKSWKP